MKDKLVSKEEIQGWIPSLDNWSGGLIIKWGMALFGLNKVNATYDRCKMYEGVEFCEHVLEDIGITVAVENVEVLDRLKDKPFVTVANHPYGHLDALGIISVVGRVRPDYKVTANFILSLIDTMSANFIRVNPYEKNNSIAGAKSVRHCLEHTDGGGALGFFPAGAVSMPKLTWKGFEVEDGQWKISTVRTIRKIGAPVVPVWVDGHNSWVYNLLGLMGWRVRTIRLPHELFNKRGKTVRIRLGEPIMPEEFAGITSGKELAGFFKDRTYAVAYE